MIGSPLPRVVGWLGGVCHDAVIGDVDDDLSAVLIGLDADRPRSDSAVSVLDAVGTGFVDHQHDVGDAGARHPDRFEPDGQSATDLGESFRGRRYLDAERLNRSRTRIDSHAGRCTPKGPLSHACRPASYRCVDLTVEGPAVVGHPGTVDTAERNAVRRLRDTRLRPRRAAEACGSPPAAAPRSRRFANCRPACCLRRRRPSCSGCSGCSGRPRRRCDRGTEHSSRRRNTRGNPMRLRRAPWVPRRIRTPAQLQPGSSCALA